MYKLTALDHVQDMRDNAFIPNDIRNSRWREYQEWLAAGNTPLPVDAEILPVLKPTNTRMVIVRSEVPGEYKIQESPVGSYPSNLIGDAPPTFKPGDEKFLKIIEINGSVMISVDWEGKSKSDPSAFKDWNSMSVWQRLKSKYSR